MNLYFVSIFALPTCIINTAHGYMGYEHAANLIGVDFDEDGSAVNGESWEREMDGYTIYITKQVVDAQFVVSMHNVMR